MSATLIKFQSKYRASVDPVLAARWDYDVRRNGEKNIKLQIAHAKRTATTLGKAIQRFSNIRPEQELAIKAAASAMSALAKELLPMVSWAKAYKKFCDAEYQREAAEELEAIAAARWGHDTAAMQFEADLIQELSTLDGKLAVAHWLHSQGQHTDVALQNISSCVGRLSEGRTLRERVAATVLSEKRNADNKWPGMNGLNVICSWRTYEQYLAHRKDVAAKTTGILKGFAA
jgi:hypothetical protein